ncbi:hypothetical protein NKH54_22680 [Mesorhizobium sp. M1004]|uniref:hypothetical protein n=1 Tax=Mesorhizobium sp. M1004 TaxID=2957046 RepID=UPI00333CD325
MEKNELAPGTMVPPSRGFFSGNRPRGVQVGETGTNRTILFNCREASAGLLMWRLPLPYWEDAMVATPKDIAQAATANAATLLRWQNSMEERATFRQSMDQSRRAIQASRELLKRLRQRQRENNSVADAIKD